MTKLIPAASLFPEWVEAHAAELALPRRIRDMHRVHGLTAGQTCGDCVHLVTLKRANTWFKCEKSRITGGAGTDWRKRWPACGLWAAGEQPTIHRMD